MANAVLNVEQSQVLSVRVSGAIGQDITAVVEVGGRKSHLYLTPNSVRAAEFKVMAQLADGSFEEVPAGPVRTYRGSILEQPGSLVAASWLDDGLHAFIVSPDGTEFWLEPLAKRIPGLSSDLHAVYQSEDIVRGGTCEAVQLAKEFREGTIGGSSAASAATVAMLALDADFDYYSDHGSSVANTQSAMESVVNTVNAQYNSQVAITHSLTTIVVRTNKRAQPYKGKSANKLLNSLRDDWNTTFAGEPRDVVHLFTGVSIAGGTIGIAYVGVVCNLSFAYGLAQSDYNNNFGCATDLSAHELGHNWGAGHCSCPSNTMNAFITCANSFTAVSINAITSYRNSQSCF